MKKIIIVILSALFIISSVIPGFAVNGDSGVIEDLTLSNINYSNYPKNNNASASLITLTEVGYDTVDKSNYKLYFYIYNPKSTALKTTSNKNSVTLAVAWDENGNATTYEKYELNIVDVSSGDYLNRFIKCQIEDKNGTYDGMKIEDRVNPNKRKYTISEIELHYTGEINATSINIGKEYIFTGYNAGCGGQVVNTLNGTVSNIKTIEAELNYTYWRSESSSLGKGHRNQINSVYFKLPKDITTQYGSLKKVKMQFEEQKLNPLIFTESETMYNELCSWVGIDIGGNKNSNITNGFVDMYTVLNKTNHHYSYNISTRQLFAAGDISYNDTSKIMRILPGIFYNNNITSNIQMMSGTELNTYLEITKNKASWLFNSNVDNGRKKGQQYYEVNADNEFNLSNYASNHNFLSSLWQKAIHGVNAYEIYENISPIQKVQINIGETNAQTSSRLYINENDVSAITDEIEDNKSDDVYLLRFAVTDYYSTKLTTKEIIVDGDTYGAEETVFFDLDVIELTFKKAETYTTIPVSASPINAVAGINSPIDEGIKIDMSWYKKILSLIMIVIVIFTVPYIFKIFNNVMIILKRKK